MTETTNVSLGPVHDLLAGKGYAVSEAGENALTIQDVETGVSIQGVLEGEILFFSLLCMTTPAQRLTEQVMRKMLGAENGISTSYFQLYDAPNGEVAVTLNNFCKLQGLGADDEDDILSCVSFLLADVVHAKQLIGADLAG
ncbi:MAG TPA: hypothetical protein VF283_20760 [Bryobacteraceae bacterium]